MSAAPDFSGYISKPGPEIPKGYFNMPEDQYHAYPAVSNGVLKESSSAEMLWNRTKPPEDSDEKEALVLGTLIHAVVLEPWKFAPDEWHKHYVESPTKGLGTKAAEETRAANPGKLLVTSELLTKAWRIRREGIETNPDALKYLDSPNGIKEATGIVWDPIHSCRRKWRIDYLPMSGRSYADFVLDVKSTRKPLHDFEWEIVRMNYHLQAAWYLDCHELLTGHRLTYWRWLAVTSFEPFLSRVYYMRNLKPTDPLYEKSKLQMARQRLGLDPSGKLGRLTQFLNSVREHEVARLENQKLDFRALRNIWPGYEFTEEIEVL